VALLPDVVDEEQDHAPSEEEEHVHGQRVRGPGRAGGVHDRGRHQEHQRGSDEVSGIETDPLGIDHVRAEKPEEEVRVRKDHGFSSRGPEIEKMPDGSPQGSFRNITRSGRAQYLARDRLNMQCPSWYR
jgi:hypothetical protein